MCHRKPKPKQEEKPLLLHGNQAQNGQETHTGQLPCCRFRPSELMGAPNHHLGLWITGCQDKDTRPVEAVRADVAWGPCGAGTLWCGGSIPLTCEQV